MLQTPGLTAAECPNAQVCGTIVELTPEEEVELLRARQEERQRWERVRVTAREAARMLLRHRGCPQTPESLGLLESLERIEARVGEVRERLGTFEGEYIAPPGCEAHRYNVKRPKGVFGYNKLTAREALFEPVEQQQRVKTIHLSYDDDARNLEAREGIARRNKLMQANTRLRQVERMMAEVLGELEA